MDGLKDWWSAVVGVLTTFVAGAIWVGKIQRDVDDIKEHTKEQPKVTQKECGERMSGCNRVVNLQFAQGEKIFSELKQLVSENHKSTIAMIGSNEKQNRERHEQMMRTIAEMNK